MNGIEKITQRIQSDAQAEINAVLTQAGRRRRRLLHAMRPRLKWKPRS